MPSNNLSLNSWRHICGNLCVFLISFITIAHARAQDVRQLSWGDTIEAALASEKALDFEKHVDSVEYYGGNVITLQATTKEQIGGSAATLQLKFFKNRLFLAVYSFDLDAAQNPFTQDVGIRYAVEKKYGEGKTETAGLTTAGWDFSDSCLRSTTWDLPRTTISLSAMVNVIKASGSSRRSLSLVYQAKNEDKVELERLYEEWTKKKRQQQSDDEKAKL